MNLYKNIHDFSSCQRGDNLAQQVCQDRHKLFCLSSSGSISYDGKYKNLRDNQRKGRGTGITKQRTKSQGITSLAYEFREKY